MNTSLMTERLRAIPTIQAIQEEPCGLELEHSPAEANARVARDNRAMLDRHGITAVDFIGAAGSGKTTLITRLVEMLRSKIGIAVVNGDVAVAEQNVPVVQIVTGIGCHLDANMLALAMMKIELEKTGLILIENCGELTHPSEFPLGCKARVLVVTVVEAAHLVRQQPHLFSEVDIVVLSKADLADVLGGNITDLPKEIKALKEN